MDVDHLRLPVVSDLKIINIKIPCLKIVVYSTDYKFKSYFPLPEKHKSKFCACTLLDIFVVTYACE